MLGLRSNGRFAGATRLLDEWLTGLEPFWAKGPRIMDDSVAAAIYGDAAARVRKFARRGAALEPVVPDAEGLMRFELQGYDYVARAKSVTPTSLDALGGLHEALREGLKALRPMLGPEEQGVFALVVAPHSTDAIESAAWVKALTELSTSAIAWAFPDARDPFGQRAVSPEQPGLCLLMAWSQDPAFAEGA